MAIDPTGTYLFVANYTAGTIGEYTFASGTGAVVTSTTAASVQVGTGVTCVSIEPLHGDYLYASNSLSNDVSGEQLVPSTGRLAQIIGAPFAASALPTCVVNVPRIF